MVSRAAPRGRWLVPSLLAATVGGLLAAPPARGQNGSWTGAGTDGRWSTVLNWLNNTPPAGGTATFGADVTNPANLTTINDQSATLTGITVAAIPGTTAGANPVSIGGQGFTLGGSGVGMSTANQNLTIALAALQSVTLGATQTWTVVGGRTLGLDSPIAGGSGAALTLLSFSTGPTFRLGAPNTYAGGTTIQAQNGIIQIGSDSVGAPGALTSGPFGTAAVTIVPNTNVPNLQGIGAVSQRTINNDFNLNSGFNFNGSVNLVLNGAITPNASRAITYNPAAGTTLTFNGPVNLPAGTTLTTSIVSGTTTASGLLVFNGVISGSNVILLLSNGNGGAAISVDQLNGQNTYSGETRVSGQGAIVQIGSSSVTDGSGNILSGPLGSSFLNANNGTTRARVVAVGGPRTVANPITLTFNLEVQGAVTAPAGAVASDLTLTGLISGPGSLFKTGPTTLTVTNANTYVGSTTVSGGRLLANNGTGSATSGGAVSVIGTGTAGTGGTLGGGNSAGTIGFIGGNVTISTATVGTTSGGTLSPGNSVGTLTVTGGTTWNPVGTYVFEHDASAPATAPVGGTSDLLKGTGAATLSLANLTPTSQFNLVLSPTNLPAGPPTVAVTYTIADFSGSSAGANAVSPPAGVVGPNADLTPFFNPNAAGSFYQDGLGFSAALVNGNVITVTFTPVPEPALVLLSCGGLTGVAAWGRGRRRTAGRV